MSIRKITILMWLISLVMCITSFTYYNMAQSKLKTYVENTHLCQEQIQTGITNLQLAEAAVDEKLNQLDIIYQLSEKYGLEPELVLAMMKIESNFDSSAQNGRCKGLLQVSEIHSTANLFDLKENCEVGLSILSELKKESNDLHEILGCYNRGKTGYKDYVSRTNQKASEYSKKVIQLMNNLKKGR